ncbi:hypothetical protein MNBD_GAMMA02-166 [hydrothermal vent metagenome]|uniref:HicB protein n=1 Tax=hydrothermal vent metagenome TaxID=652676 RepID=A0A3B0WLU5_9ZZZZ
MKHKGYEAVIKYSDEDETFIGEVINTSDILVFDGETVDEVRISFVSVVNEYLEDCEKEGKKPQKPFSGKFMTRINPALHQNIFVKARKTGVSLNKFVEKALEEKLSA